MWVKGASAAAAVVCSACLVGAAAISVVDTGEERLATTTVSPDMKLTLNLSALDAFGALPLYADFLDNPSQGTLLALLGGIGATDATPLYASFLLNPNETTLLALLNGIDATDATPLYAAFLADPSEETALELLGGIDATDATPLYANFLADPSADTALELLGGIDATDATPLYANFLADPSADTALELLGGIDATSATPNILNFVTSGDLSRESGLSGIDAFSALPVYNAVLLHGDIGALAPDTETVEDESIGGFDALSAVPGLLGIPATVPAPDIPYVAPTTTLADTNRSAATSTESAPVKRPLQQIANAVANALPGGGAATPAPAIEAPKPEGTPDSGNGKTNLRNVIRDSVKATPEGINGGPILFGGSGGADNGMPGWNKMLKKVGLGGPSESEGEGPSGPSGPGS